MQEDFLYLEDGIVRVSQMAMQAPEFKDFRRYDSSTNKIFFDKAMAYIYYVYKVFGEEKSYLHNYALHQRRVQAVKHHTGTYKSIDDFEKNDWVKGCIDCYLKFSRTRPEVMFDTLKDDIDMYIDKVQKIPHTIKKVIKIPYNVIDEDDPDGKRTVVKLYDVEIDVANTDERLKALKQASDLNDYYNKLKADVEKAAKGKNSKTTFMFENKDEVKNIKIPSNDFPTSTK